MTPLFQHFGAFIIFFNLMETPVFLSAKSTVAPALFKGCLSL